MFSIVIPIHNEAQILDSLVEGIVSGLQAQHGHYEIILAENGSSDSTLSLAESLAERYPQIVVLSAATASYGEAIKQGILNSQGDQVIIFNADLWDLEFLHQSVELLRDYDIVIASKRHVESQDQRPLNRRFITWGFNRLLWLLFGFQGTDTHGMKAFRRRLIVPVVEQCITGREIFDSELILRAQQAGLSSVELPTVVEELRPSRYSPFVRIPRTLKDLGVLWFDLYFNRRAKELSSGSDQL